MKAGIFSIINKEKRKIIVTVKLKVKGKVIVKVKGN